MENESEKNIYMDVIRKFLKVVEEMGIFCKYVLCVV